MVAFDIIGSMATVHEVIEASRHAPSNSERGTKFEKLMVRHFELDPLLAKKYDKVWRWPDRKGKPDTGIDLVTRERDTGELTAVQCKFYEPAPEARHIAACRVVPSALTCRCADALSRSCR